MILSNLKNALIELGLPKAHTEDLLKAHNRYIRTNVENTPTLSRISEFMDDYRDEHGNEATDLAIAHGAIMYFSRAKLNFEFSNKFKERLAKNAIVESIIRSYQEKNDSPEYDELAINDEMFDL